MLQEPFFLHPPGARPRDGIYINPMSSPFINEPHRAKDSESFYLHSPHDLVYTRITHLFGDNEKSRSGSIAVERKDETLTGKWHVPDTQRFVFNKAALAQLRAFRGERPRLFWHSSSTIDHGNDRSNAFCSLIVDSPPIEPDVTLLRVQQISSKLYVVLEFVSKLRSVIDRL